MATVEALQVKLKQAVKQYEGKLAALSALNSALQQECDQLRDELDEALQPRTEAELDALELKEEFARRLGEHQRTIDILKDTNQRLQAKIRDAAADSSAADSQLTSLHDNNTVQQQEILQLTARVAELEKGWRRSNHRNKELENERDKYASRVEVLEIQLSETQQVAAAAEQQTTARIQLLQQEHQQQLTAAEQQVHSAQAELQRQLDAAQHAAAAGSERAAAAAAEREAMLSAALADAQAAVQAYQSQHEDLEQRHRKALQRLQEQVRQLELEKQDILSGSGSADTSLMRHIQSLAAQLSATQKNAIDQEQLLLARLRAAEQAVAEASAAERDATGRTAAAEAAETAARQAAAAAVQESVTIRSQLQSAQRNCRKLEAEITLAQNRLAAVQAREQQVQQELQLHQQQSHQQLQEAMQQVQLLTEQKHNLQQQLDRLQQEQQHQAAAAAISAAELQLQEQRVKLAPVSINGNSSSNLQQRQQQQEPGALQEQQQTLAPANHQSSRSDSGLTGLLQHLGLSSDTTTDLSDSDHAPASGSSPLVSDSFKQQQQQWGIGSSEGPILSPRLSNTPEMQQLQRLLLQQQKELAAASREREAASEQLYQAMRQADAAAVAVHEAEQLRQQQLELEKKLEVAMEIIGERSLQVEELEQDILEMKAIFHAQLEEAMAQVSAAAASSKTTGGGSCDLHNHVE